MVGTGNGSQGSPDVLAGTSLRRLHWDLGLWSVGPLGDETQVPWQCHAKVDETLQAGRVETKAGETLQVSSTSEERPWGRKDVFPVLTESLFLTS